MRRPCFAVSRSAMNEASAASLILLYRSVSSCWRRL